MTHTLLVRLLAASVVATLLTGCAGGGTAAPPRPRDAPGAASPLPTSQSSLSPQVAGVAAALRQQLQPAGLRLDVLGEPYHPSEPAALANVPRTIFTTGLPEAEDGYIVVYEFPDAATAATVGREFANYLASGFGQTNYPLDAQFSLAQSGSTLIFTWWSRERSTDTERAEAAFRAVARVGQPVEVRK